MAGGFDVVFGAMSKRISRVLVGLCTVGRLQVTKDQLLDEHITHKHTPPQLFLDFQPNLILFSGHSGTPPRLGFFVSQ